MALIEFTDKGIYCPQANFYVDPSCPVKNAIITHAHSDHAKPGNSHYLAVNESIPILRYKLGSFINISGLDYGESLNVNQVKISFHPAGHIIGSAQIRLEYKGEVWVISGDYKLENDGISQAFESLKCHTFVTESTFGMSDYKWKKQEIIFDDINKWWLNNKSLGKASIISAYALGKAQRILYNIDVSIDKVYTHGAIENINNVFRKQGFNIPIGDKIINNKKESFAGSLILAPPNAINLSWVEMFGEVEYANVSGWVAKSSYAKKDVFDTGFALSDHADWEGLNSAVRNSQAEKIYVTHGFTKEFSKWLNNIGYDAEVVNTNWSEF